MPPDIKFQTLDRNHDGKLSREEWMAKFGDEYAQLFDTYDKDGDGSISAEEFMRRKLNWK